MIFNYRQDAQEKQNGCTPEPGIIKYHKLSIIIFFELPSESAVE